MTHDYCCHSARVVAVKESKQGKKVSVFQRRRNLAKQQMAKVKEAEKLLLARKKAAMLNIKLADKEKKQKKTLRFRKEDKTSKALQEKKKEVKQIRKDSARGQKPRKRIEWVNERGKHSNDIEAEWGKFKKYRRMRTGTIKVSKENLPLYISEYCFRRNLTTTDACTCEIRMGKRDGRAAQNRRCPDCVLQYVEKVFEMHTTCNIIVGHPKTV